MSRKRYKENWASAIADAKAKLAAGRLYVGSMKGVIKTLEKKMAAGEPWPGDKAA